MDNIINITGFNANSEALDGNGNRIVLHNNTKYFVIKPTNEINDPDKIITVEVDID